ncbi:MAG: ABC transporter permease [Betaproteobacteria bacterium]|nr:ABC transporter permease [Betaproteobacteria bacterium]
MTRGRGKLWLGGTLVMLIVLLGLFAPWVSVDPGAQDLKTRFKPPAWEAAGTLSRPLGTDEFGRDVMSRIVHGARISLVIGLAAVVLSVGVGAFAGLLAATGGRRTERTILQLIDAQTALPPVLIAIITAAVMGASVTNIVLVLGITGWSLFARVVYTQTLSLRERDYVTAARALGAGTARILAWHILPNLFGTLSVLTALQVGRMILMESSLSFLGVGVPLSTPSWGGMLADARKHLWIAPWLTVLPGIAIGITVWGISLLGDGLKERLGARTPMGFT